MIDLDESKWSNCEYSLVGPNSVNYSKKLSELIKTTVFSDALKSISMVE